MPAPIPVRPGDKFGRLTVVKELPSNKGGRRVACRCDCGATKVVLLKSIRTGNTLSCGCLRSQMVTDNNTVHGLSKLPEYRHWKAMKQRCFNPSCKKYLAYAGKGVTVCARWQDFQLFLKDMGRMPTRQHSLDRYPNRNGNYEPGNVRWATPTEQTRNRNCTKTVVFDNEVVSVASLADRFGIDIMRLQWRLNNGWTVLEAVFTPVLLGANGSNVNRKSGPIEDGSTGR